MVCAGINEGTHVWVWVSVAWWLLSRPMPWLRGDGGGDEQSNTTGTDALSDTLGFYGSGLNDRFGDASGVKDGDVGSMFPNQTDRISDSGSGGDGTRPNSTDIVHGLLYLVLSELFLHGFCMHPYFGFFLGTCVRPWSFFAACACTIDLLWFLSWYVCASL
jgi:hypothetical protein